MTKTTGRIAREGEIHFGDASLSVWEEGIPREWDPKVKWEQKFKREVFARIVQTLNRIGWTCTMPPINLHSVKHYGGNVERWSRERKRFCVKGDLKADLEISGRTITLQMFQSVNCPTRSDHEGRYERDKEACMPYPLRLEMERTRRRIREYLMNVFTGYEFEPERYPKMGLMGLTAYEKAAHDRRTTGHYKPALDRAEISMKSNAIAADGGTIEHGAHVWALDYKGRVITGTAYYDLNSAWQIVTGRYGLVYCHTGEIFTRQPDHLRLKRNQRERRKRLEQELQKAVARMDFKRAEVLKNVLFPDGGQLFHIFSNKHDCYFRANYCGYTKDTTYAGRYTEAELKPYASEIANGTLKAIPITQGERA